MSRTPGWEVVRASLVAALLFGAAAPAATATTSFSLRDGMAPMGSFRDGVFTMRARPEFERPDGYIALAFGSSVLPRKYYMIVTRTGMKLWKLGDGGERRLLDEGALSLSQGQEISLRFAIVGSRYMAEIAGYPPLMADDEASFKGRLVLRASGARIDYSDPLVELRRL